MLLCYVAAYSFTNILGIVLNGQTLRRIAILLYFVPTFYLSLNTSLHGKKMLYEFLLLTFKVPHLELWGFQNYVY